MMRFLPVALLVSCLILSAPAANGGAADESLEAAIGRSLFERAWVPAPASTRANDGLGPLYNARACTTCHAGLARAALIDRKGQVGAGIVLRLGDSEGRPDPRYGRQLQTAAIPGFEPEGRLLLSGDGKIVADLANGAFAPTTLSGGRAAPALRGLGLLERIDETAILANADPEDADGDGISGRPYLLTDGRVGRFGWKASAPSLADQVALAFSLDLGMSTAQHPSPAGDCTPAESSCLAGPHGGTAEQPEIAPEIVAMLAAYLTAAPAPAADVDIAGERLFAATGCAACHRPALATGDGAPVRAFTDLLLHDLGPGLDGGATEPGVAPTEWRTAPLWGLSRALAAGTGLLHDGRATDVAAAIGWHGGEATAARERFDALSPEDRKRLLDYVASR